MRIALLLRGHIRAGFMNDDLYTFCKLVLEKYNADIFIHSWSVFSGGKSHRRINNDLRPVTTATFYEYFRDCSKSIKSILIDDDAQITLTGITEGYLSNTSAYMRSWKNYWYGQYRLINHLKQNYADRYDLLINTRFDIMEFDRYRIYKNVSIKDFHSERLLFRELFDRIEEALDVGITTKNLLYYDTFEAGIDNFMIGTIDTMHSLIYNLHTNLDSLIVLHEPIYYQEALVYLENNRL
jgi:hypothetical protein